MGFSLSRALAGAVAGASNAVVEIADFNIKQRATMEAEARAEESRRKLMLEQEEIADRREASKDALKAKRDELNREKDSSAFKAARDLVLEKNPKLTTKDGEFWLSLADQAEGQGYNEKANSYRSIGMGLFNAKENRDMRAEETRQRIADRAAARASSGSGSGKEDKEELRLAKETDKLAEDSYEVTKPKANGDGVFVDKSGVGPARAMVSNLRAQGVPERKIQNIVGNHAEGFQDIIQKNPETVPIQAFKMRDTQIGERVAAAKAAPAQKVVSPAAAPAVAPIVQDKKLPMTSELSAMSVGGM